MAKYQGNSRLGGKSLPKWLDEPVFELGNAVVSRREFVKLSESPCTRAARNLQETCRRYHLTTVKQLHAIGLDGLLRCAGVGERTSWVAAELLDHFGFDVESWMAVRRRKVLSWRGAIKKVQDQTRKQKHA